MTQKGKVLFFDKVSQQTWPFVSDSSIGVDERFDMFMRVLDSAYLESFPERTYRVRSDQSGDITWFTDELREMRERLYLLRELTQQYSNNNEYKENYKKFKLSYKQAIRNAKIIANDNLLRSANNPIKAMWQIINYNRSNNNGKYNVEPNISPNDFNTFFTNVAHNLIKDLPPSNIDPLDYLIGNVLPPTDSQEFLFRRVGFNTVRDIIDGLKNKKGRDEFGMSVQLIKSVKHIILAPLTKLINLCIDESIFPSILKHAIVVPIYKKGNNHLPENYRPISLLPIISKIFEKCMVVQLASYFERLRLFSNSQWGFRRGRSAGNRESCFGYFKQL